MEAKLLHDVMLEFISLQTGTYHLAKTLCAKAFPQDNEHAIFSPEFVRQALSRMAQAFSFASFALDVPWGEKLLRDLATIASSRGDFSSPVRSCKAKIDYLPYLQGQVPDLDEEDRMRFNHEIEESNKHHLVVLSHQVADLVNHLNSSNSVYLEKPGLPTLELFVLQLNCKRLLRWLEKAVIVDMITPVSLALSREGHDLLTFFRDHPRSRHIPDELARMVFFVLDRRRVWDVVQHLEITSDELVTTVVVVCETVKEIRSNAYYPGSLQSFKELGIYDGPFERATVSTRVNPEFEELGLWKVTAQRMYEEGSSVEEVLTTVRMCQAYDEVASGSWHPKLSSRSNLPPVRSSKGETIRVSGSSSDDIQSLPHHTATRGGPASSPYVSDRARNTPSKSDAGDAGLIGSGTPEEGCTGLVQNSESTSEIPRVLDNLLRSFGHDIVEFDSIDLGLTGILEAKVPDVKGALRLAFSRELKRNLSAPGEAEWNKCLRDTDIWLVALSYKHRSRKERMSIHTMDKVARAIADIAAKKGFSKVNIWLDSILSASKDQQNGLWAVRGMYPYLVCDVVRIEGQDEHYNDSENSSLWMEIEDLCADEETKIHLTLDRSSRGYSWKQSPTLPKMRLQYLNMSPEEIGTSYSKTFRDISKLRSNWYHPGKTSMKARMMMLAQEMCKCVLIGKSSTWNNEKRKLIMWAEACMLRNGPLLMNTEQLEELLTLEIDNRDYDKVEDYVSMAVKGGFVVNGSLRETGAMVQKGWLGVFEVVPGLSEASRGYKRLLKCVPNEQRRKKRIWAEGLPSDVVETKIGGVMVFAVFDYNSDCLRDVWVEPSESQTPSGGPTRSAFQYDTEKLQRFGVDFQEEQMDLNIEDERVWLQ